MPKEKTKVKLSPLSIAFWCLIAVFTVTFVVIMITNGIKYANYTRVSQLTHLKSSQVFNQEGAADGTYYVWFYSEDYATEQQEAVKDTVLTYASYAKSHKNTAFPIYVVNVDASANSTIMSKSATTAVVDVSSYASLVINWSDMSLLATVTSGGSISLAQTTELSIRSALSSAMTIVS